MKVHLLSLPHTQTTRAYSWCAFTEKVRKMSSMLHDIGYDVRLYSGDENEARCTEHVSIAPTEWQQRHFGHYVWTRDVFNEFGPELPHWQEFNAAAIAAIRERYEPGDIIGMSMGWSHRPVAEAFPDAFWVETGIGYPGVWAPYRVYESHAWEHYLAARRETDDARFFDAVIPNYFEVEDFPLGRGDGGYLLFVGRFIRRKGVEIAVEIANQTGLPLVMAGQGVTRDGITYRGIDVEVTSHLIEYVGVVGPEERAKLYGGAIATLTPSIYLEPFCGVSVESQLCGTPVISTDWGAFVENVENGVSGYRCRTLNQFVNAADDVRVLDRNVIRNAAVARWSTTVIAKQYDTYFKQLQTLHRKGWYELDKDAKGRNSAFAARLLLP